MNENISELILTCKHVLEAGLNNWGNLHPIVVHFPIVLLCLPPFFLLAGLIFKNNQKPLFFSGLILMLIGTGSIYLATSSGNHAAEPLQVSLETVKTLEAHVRLAEKARLIFCILTGVFFLYMVPLAPIHKNWGKKVNITILVIYTCVYIYAVLMLLNAAHYGGKMVHHHGIKSNLYKEQ